MFFHTFRYAHCTFSAHLTYFSHTYQFPLFLIYLLPYLLVWVSFSVPIIRFNMRFSVCNYPSEPGELISGYKTNLRICRLPKDEQHVVRPLGHFSINRLLVRCTDFCGLSMNMYGCYELVVPILCTTYKMVF